MRLFRYEDIVQEFVCSDMKPLFKNSIMAKTVSRERSLDDGSPLSRHADLFEQAIPLFNIRVCCTRRRFILSLINPCVHEDFKGVAFQRHTFDNGIV